MRYGSMISGFALLMAMPAVALPSSGDLPGATTNDGRMRPGSPSAEKVRSARYGLNDNLADFYEDDSSEGVSIRWRLTKLKMRMPFSTTGMQ